MGIYRYKQLSKNFNLHEFTISRNAEVLGIDNTPSLDVLSNLQLLAAQLERVRRILRNQPMIITSGYRCPRLNIMTPGSSPTSHHMVGWAADFVCPGFGNPLGVAWALEAASKESVPGFLRFDQLIYEYNWVHISFHPLLRQQIFTRTMHGETVGLPPTEGGSV